MTVTVTDTAYHLRPVTDDDWPFLSALYASTRHDEMAQTNWSRADIESFLAMQFEMQRRHYAEYFPDAAFSVVEVRGQRAGRLYLDRREDEIRIVDIALMPRYRGKGIGGRMMRDILDQATERGVLVRIHVEQQNPAMHLYERLGFQRIEIQGVYYLMEWLPPRKTP